MSDLEKINSILREGPERFGLFLQVLGVESRKCMPLWYMASAYAGAMELLEMRGRSVRDNVMGWMPDGLEFRGSIGRCEDGQRRVVRYTVGKGRTIRMEVYRAAKMGTDLDIAGKPLFSVENIGDEFLMEVLAAVAISEEYLPKK